MSDDFVAEAMNAPQDERALTSEEYKEIEPELLRVVNKIIGKFVAQAVAATWEEAARIADNIANESAKHYSSEDFILFKGRRYGAQAVAAAIRARAKEPYF